MALDELELALDRALVTQEQKHAVARRASALGTPADALSRGQGLLKQRQQVRVSGRGPCGDVACGDDRGFLPRPCIRGPGALRAVAQARTARQSVVEGLVSTRVLWPLIDHAPSCHLCAAPRQPPLRPDIAHCRSCRGLKDLYDDALADLYPISYTTPQTGLCVHVRDLKDSFHARSDTPLTRAIGATLSAYLEAQLGGGRLGLSREFGVVTTVPSSAPVIAAALQRACVEGWWSCELAAVARARTGHPRQRQRPDAVRMHVRDKWEVDGAAVNGLDVLVLDDVYTSGGSVHSFAQALRNAGAASVRAIILARNLRGDHGAWVLPLLREHHNAGCRWTASANKYDVIGRVPAAIASPGPGTPTVTPRAEGSRGPAQNAAREAPPRICQPGRPR